MGAVRVGLNEEDDDKDELTALARETAPAAEREFVAHLQKQLSSKTPGRKDAFEDAFDRDGNLNAMATKTKVNLLVSSSRAKLERNCMRLKAYAKSAYDKLSSESGLGAFLGI